MVRSQQSKGCTVAIGTNTAIPNRLSGTGDALSPTWSLHGTNMFNWRGERAGKLTTRSYASFQGRPLQHALLLGVEAEHASKQTKHL